jgi:putative ABC transport system permease protein
VLYTDLSDQLPQYATLKAMGYDNAYLVQVVLTQSIFYALIAWLPAWGLGLLLYRLIGDVALLPMHMTFGIVIGTLAITIAMCAIAGLLAVRRVLKADPSDVF